MAFNFAERLNFLAASHLRREKHTRVGMQGAAIELEAFETNGAQTKSTLINVSSNDYLGLAHHPSLTNAAISAMQQHGNGAGASRLLSGNYSLLNELETNVAAWLGYERALWFSSGYLANIGIIPALAEAGDHIFSDELNHASTIDGCRLSKATLHVFPHGDTNTLKRMLIDCPKSGQRFILSETIFSMDGDVAPVRELRKLADDNDAFLILDEAHAVGSYGPSGAGVARAHNISADAIVGTFGKALGSQGAFVAASSDCIEWLWNRARSHVFVTAPHPAVVGSALAGVAVARSPEGDTRRATLQRHIAAFGGTSAIVPWVIGRETHALDMTKTLATAGYWAQAVRPPTVAPGTSRLRIVLSAAHTDHQISGLLAVCKQHGFLPGS